MAERDLPEPEITARRGITLSWVWLMPVFALAISAFVVLQAWRGQGPIIVVTLPSASGVEAGETPLRFRDVQVGEVEELEFSDGFGAVEAHIRIDSDVAPYVDADAEFWLVEPEVTARGVTGLSTVLSGVYFEGTWDGDIGEPQDRFAIRDDTPLSLPGERGTRIVLRSRDGGQLAAGAPVLYNGIEVGRLGVPILSENGTIVTMDAFIEAPHDARLSTNTRFWDISGISVDLNASGLSVNFDSLASLLEGGVTFQSLVTGGEPVEEGQLFDVFTSREEAQRSVFVAAVEQVLPLSVVMPTDDLRLGLGALVRYRGIRVGEVTNIIGFTDPRAPEDGVQILVTFSIAPARIGLTGDGATTEDLIADLAVRVGDGLRVRVASEGLLGTSLILELHEDEDPDGQQLATDLIETPLMPSSPPNVTEASADLDAIVARVAALPIEDLMNSAIDALDGITRLSTGEEINALPANLNELVSEARSIVAAEEIATILTDLSDAAQSVQELFTGIADSDGLTTALAALEGSDTIMANLEGFSGRLPGVLTSVEELIAQIDTAPLTAAATSADEVLQRIDTILSAPSAETLPDDLAALIAEARAVVAGDDVATILTDLAGAADTLQTLVTGIADSEGLSTTLTALEGTDTIIANLQGFTEGLPDVLTSVEEVIAGVDVSPVTAAANSADRVLLRIEDILSSESADGLPDTLNTALTELGAILATLREGGAAENLTGTLSSADSAFSALQSAAEQVPAIVTRLNSLVTSLQGLAADYDDSSPVNRDLRAAIADISQAADAFRSLARAIERNPNSLITGR
ncbi:MlaD family protein [Jannaschia sp. CCS1]|uniref:MlaD family protein n=1 Tax=Jannaschia sp. (strain CCS1) TaxID=290400 RepID=UPI000053CD58|nr:MlaD family protein [Jannaschia sp. CCS1]ABD54488.1 Mammalian cell entry-related protein [Jannaschia sp. CCS1]